MRVSPFFVFIASWAVAAAMLLAPRTAPACGCDPTGGFVVAHGSSPTGVPWRWKAREITQLDHRRGALLNFSSGSPDDYGDGFGSGFALPPPQAFVVHGVSSGLILPGEGEPSLAGFARRKAVRLDARMSDGTVLTVERQLPPPALERMLPWLKSLAFFNAFYANGAKPISISAYAADGRSLGRESLSR